MRRDSIRTAPSKKLNSQRDIVSGLQRWPRRKSSLAVRILPRLLVAFSLTGLALAQSPSQTPPQPNSQQPHGSPGAEAPKANAHIDDPRPGKVYTDDDVEALPPGGISVVGPATPAPRAANSATKASTGSASAKPADQTANAAAYWKARFTAARNKLAQDQKALPVLQSQLDYERVQQYSVDEDTGQVNSDRFMYLLHQIEATKLAIPKDKQALSDLHEEFRRAGGLPGWIR
jgi:hypothetical protein